ncbi:type II secretion system protein [Thalassotalea sp. G2M2-11]|uniref:type IV pilus modification PilV family protein n=1 Tax=Thalassotalea sp. G2M2-11 TaxID=2787627 RepID=UPI0019CFE49C|nr:type II secretion system protein [Thalassotalea sp. G2M2-11]
MQVKPHGFTLIETIVGIVVLSISFSILTSLIYPLAEQSADQLHQIKASELAQSMFNEIQQKAFDENSDKTGGLLRCGEAALVCTLNNALGNEESDNRANFDDVDDYDGLNLSSADIENSLGDKLGDWYQGFSMSITVCNDGNYDGICSERVATNTDTDTAKLIRLTVTTPTGFDIEFATYRANF